MGLDTPVTIAMALWAFVIFGVILLAASILGVWLGSKGAK